MKVRIKDARRYTLSNHFNSKIYYGTLDSSSGLIMVNVGKENSFSEYLSFTKDELEVIGDEPQQDEHYNNENGSLYLFAQQHDLNAWEFDILKRIVRCRKKGQFTDDLEKTKRVIDLYLKEFLA